MKAKKVIKPIDEPVRQEVAPVEPEQTCPHNSLAQQGSFTVCLLCGRQV